MIGKLFSLNVDPRHPPYRESKALVAQGHRQGCILEYTGTHIGYEVEGGAQDLTDFGLDDAPKGLSIWEGRYHYDPGYDSPNGPAEGSSDPVGEFRRLTPEEWTKLARDGFLWPKDPDPDPANEVALELTGTDNA
jgi:hypothetical protein